MELYIAGAREAAAVSKNSTAAENFHSIQLWVRMTHCKTLNSDSCKFYLGNDLFQEVCLFLGSGILLFEWLAPPFTIDIRKKMFKIPSDNDPLKS